jgi:hypothetical protein
MTQSRREVRIETTKDLERDRIEPLQIFMDFVSIACAITLIFASPDGRSVQQAAPSFTKSTSDTVDSVPALRDAATEAQIREYLKISGEADDFRKSWIAAVDKDRSSGEPYWPESFWQAVKDEMQKTDLVPMYVTLFQHGVSRELMQEVLDSYRVRGRDHFQGSSECFKLGTAVAAVQGEFEELKLAETQAVVLKVYAAYKPQIKAARARYLLDHPDWKDK